MDTIKLDLQAKLLIFAFVVAPFTLLRFGFLGLGEIILLVYFLLDVSKKITKKDWEKFYVTKFWILYLFISILGLGYNVFILDHETGTYKGMIFDFAAYIMLLFSSFVLEYIIIVKKINTYLFLKYAFFSLSIVLSFLYIFSFFTPTLFGLPLKYFNFFAPFVKNVHQIAMMIAPLVFIGIKVFKEEKEFLLRVVILVLIIMDINMALNTGATKAMLGILVGGVIVVIMIPLVKYERTIKYLILLLTSILVLLISTQTNIAESLERDFQEADAHGARAVLYTNALEVSTNSLIFGNGTGQHIKNEAGEYMDVHETYLTVLLQTGLIGLFLFISLVFRIGNNIINHPSLLAAYFAILIYATGGDILRRLPIWFILIFLFHYSSQDEPGKNKKHKLIKRKR